MRLYIFSLVMLRQLMIPLVATTFATIGKNIFTRSYYYGYTDLR